MANGTRRTDYLLDNADPRAEHRFDALGQLFDADTIAYLSALGVSPCLLYTSPSPRDS